MHPPAQLEYEPSESNREDRHATTIPLPESMNLHAPIRKSKLVGAWPFLFVCPSLHVQCILGMVLGIQLWMMQVVVAILDPLRKVLSFSHVEIQYKLEIDSQLPCAKE